MFLKNEKSIKTKVITQVTSFVSIIIVLAICLISYFNLTYLHEKENDNLQKKAYDFEHDVNQKFEYLKEKTEILAKNELIINSFIDNDVRDKYLLPLLKNFKENSHLNQLRIVDFDGRIIFQIVGSKAKAQLFHELSMALSLAQTITYIRENELIFIVPIKYYNTTQGAIIATFDIKNIVEEFNHLDHNMYAKFYHQGKEYYSKNFTSYESYYTYKSEDDKSHPFLYNLGTTFEIGILKQTYLHPLYEQLIVLSIVGFFIFLIALFLSYKLAESIVKPILNLFTKVTQTALHTSTNEYVPLGSQDELEVLGYAFFKKTKALEALNKSLQVRKDVALKASQIGIWEWSFASNTLVWDEQMYEIYGFKKTTDVNPYTMWSQAIVAEELSVVEENLQNAVKNQSDYDIAFWITTPAGEKRYIKAFGVNELDENGKAFRMVGTNQNITAIKMAEHKYSTILNLASDGIFIMNTEGRLIECSKQAAKLLGYSMEEMKNLYVYNWDVLHTKEEALNHIKNTPLSTMSFESKHRRKDGSMYDAAITAAKIYIADNYYIYASVRDITHQKEIESVLLETNKKLINISENVPGAIYTYQLFEDGRSCFPYASEHIYSVYGVSHQDVRKDATKVFNALHPDDLVRVANSIKISFEKLTLWEDEYRVIHPDKGLLWLKGVAKPEKQTDGSVLWYGYIYNITEHKLDELKIENAKHYYETLLEFASDGIHILDQNGNIVAYSRSFAEHLGYEYNEVKNLNVKDWNSAIPQEELINTIEMLIRMPKIFITKHRRKDGTVLDVQISAKAIDLDGKTYLYGASRDITESERLKKEIIKERNFVSTLVNNSNAIIAVINSDGTMISLNQYGQKFTGYLEKEVSSQPYFWLRFLKYDIQEKVLEIIKEAKEGSLIKTFQNSWISRSGEERLFEWSNALMLKPDGNMDYIFTIGLDITESESMQQEFKTIFDISRDGLAIMDLESNFLDFNDAYQAMSGYSRAELLSTSCLALSLPEDKDTVKKALQLVFENGFLESLDKTCVHKNGKLVSVKMAFSLMPDKKRIMVSTKDITDIKNHEQELEFIAHFDPLTKLPNRVLFADRIKQSIANANRNNLKIAIAYLDLDGFKFVNDTYGHDTGDQLLIEVSKLMQNTLREGDTLARFGGDEFIAILGNQNNESETFTILNRLLEAASSTITIENIIINISTSIGVTFYSRDINIDADMLIRQADQAMYEAKLRGKNQIVFFDDMFNLSNNISDRALSIKNALTNNEFVLYYQPKINMLSSEVIGVEALIRWNDPVRGMIYPDDFLHIVDNRPLMYEIDKWVLNEALSQICLWSCDGFDTNVSINISAYTFKQPDFIAYIDYMLEKYSDILPYQIDIEILESSTLHEIEEIQQIIKKFHDRNITVSLDDFGTGYSTLSYLKNLGIDTLKIDKSFIVDILHDSGDLSIVSAAIGLAEAFNAKPLAEGVESIEHGDVLIQLGCQLAQGYFISRPINAALIPKWAKEWKSPKSWRIQ